MTTGVRTVAGLLVVVGLGRSADGQCELAELFALDGASNDYFGTSVAVSGDVVLVGAFGDDNYAGAAYVFRRDGTSWIQEQKLTASDGASGDYFGSSVAVSGDVALVGAYGDDGLGAAYVFRYGGTSWIQEQKLTASDGASGDIFGYSVAVSGDAALVGAILEDNLNGSDSGAAYVFRYDGTGWIEEQKLTASDGASNDRFGWSVAVSGDMALVGVTHDDNKNGGDSGAAFVFRHDGTSWIQEQKLTASDGALGDNFGSSVAVSGDVALVGALGNDNQNGSDAGAAYMFSRDGTSWIQEQKLTASDGASNDNFGISVAVAGTAALIGAYAHDVGHGAATNRGSAYVFGFNGSQWSETLELLASDGVSGDLFGISVGLDGSTLIAGAPYHDAGPPDSGSAYVFALSTGFDCNANGIPDGCDLLGPSPDCNGNAIPDECDIADGTSPDFNFNDVPDECEPDCNGNGLPDFLDLALGLSEDCNFNAIPDECDIESGFSEDLNGDGVPDECEQDCNSNGIPDFLDVIFGISEDCNGDGVPDECGTDCNGNGTADECDVFDGTSQDCNADSTPDECQADCNGNAVPDDCDIAGATSEDCNLNAVPDECDIGSGASEDCNRNGLPDECDLLDATSADCNANAVPDECDIASGHSLDADGSGVPDECECLADINGSGAVEVQDFLLLLAYWGPCGDCRADLDGDGVVAVGDMLDLLAAWGPCG